MANRADTDYKVTGTRKAVENLWNTLQEMEVNAKNVYLDDLAKHYGIDYEKKCISVRGDIYWAEFEEDKENNRCILSFATDTAWDACNELFEEINHTLNDELSISYRVCECGCEVFYVHDEESFFPEECCVYFSGDIFGNGSECTEDLYNTIEEAIKLWMSKTGIEQGERTNDEMVKFIHDYEYEDNDAETYFYIFPFVFE